MDTEPVRNLDAGADPTDAAHLQRAREGRLLKRLFPLLLLALLAVPGIAGAQAPAGPPAVEAPFHTNPVSGRGAFARSLLLPGLGHRAVDGRWGTAGTALVMADAALWTGLFGTTWRRSSLVDSYETLATSAAGADLDGKNRAFILRLASYRSSDEYFETALRLRAWEDLEAMDDPAYRWSWSSEEDYLRFRELRNDAESLGRRRTLIVASLVANRLLAGILSARRAGRPSDLTVALRPAPAGARPAIDLALRF